jgi:formylglycine-generating enzyme required for sulfatase activity
MKRKQAAVFSMLEEMDIEVQEIEKRTDSVPAEQTVTSPEFDRPESGFSPDVRIDHTEAEERPELPSASEIGASFGAVASPSAIPASLDMSFVHIPAGTFVMGSPEYEIGRNRDETQHEVTLSRGFYMQTTLVTRRQWKIVMEGSLPRFANEGPDYPIAEVSWNECQEFIRRLNAAGEHLYRLPTEAEWEYACRAGTVSAFSGGEISSSGQDPYLDEVAWYSYNSAGRTHYVAQKKPNQWALYDMHGNLCEWCQDWYGEYPAVLQTDPPGLKRGRERVCRGGCWISSAENCRSACRFHWTPDTRSDFVGFRLVRL